MRNRKNKSSKVNIAIIVAVATVAIVFILSVARYSSTFANENSTYIATPILNISSGETLEFYINTYEEKIYYFGVTNYNELDVSEVTMEYYIEINSNSNLPLEFELYEYENEEIGTTNLLEKNGTVTDKIEIDLNEEIIHNYALKISWQEDDINYEYASEIDYIEIVVYGEQVD